jgi:hypothetical protein
MDQKVWVPQREMFEQEVESRVRRATLTLAALGSLNGTAQDLTILQKAVDDLIAPITDSLMWQSLGIVFGRVLANEIGLEWVMVSDEYGCDPALRYPSSTTLLFPLTMISKRIERGERPDVQGLFDQIRIDITARNHEILPLS